MIIQADDPVEKNPLFADRANENAYASMRAYYNSGITRSALFRRKQLDTLKKAVLRYENLIREALFTDLKKSTEEAFLTETGLLLNEINFASRNLARWMRPERRSTDLINFPSSCKLYKDPLGIVFIISPWNYPFQLLFIPLVGAIAAGNCAVLKPSELAPATAALIEKIVSEIFPPEYIRVLQGDGSSVVPATMRSCHFDHIFYTGSPAVGKAVYQMAAEQMIPVTLELGGKSPVIVEADADLSVTARRICFGKFLNAGQTCVAPDYVLVHESVKEELLDQLQISIAGFFGLNAFKSPDYARIINRKRFLTLSQLLNQGNIRLGGATDEASMYIEPTVMDQISLDSPIMQEEIFGPILPIIPFSSRESALEILARNPNPLSLYLFSRSKTNERFWLENIAFGNGCVNNTVCQFSNPNLPFGGIAMSGLGAYHGKYSFDLFSHNKPIMKTPFWPDPAFRYPPYRNKLKWLKLFFK